MIISSIKTNPFAALFVALSVFVASFGLAGPSFAQSERLDELFEELQDPNNKLWQRTEEKIWKEWGKSGSDAMDYLLERGRIAMREGDIQRAIGHFSVLIEQAPEFAEGYNARATAFFLAEEFGLSMSDISQTLKRNPRHFGALSGMVQILSATNRLDEALLVARRALELSPNNAGFQTRVEELEKLVGGTEL